MFLLYAENITPRLKYIVDFFSSELFDHPIKITTSLDDFDAAEQPKLNYSLIERDDSEFFIQRKDLLFESGIRAQHLECFEINFHKALFETKGDLAFDIFAGTFYLLSRYEEYLPHHKDEYGRFSHTSSLAFREKFLHEPLINIWIAEFKKALLKKFPGMVFRKKQFKCIISYDIDIAYSYLHKGWIRNAGGLIRSLFTGEWTTFRNRVQVLRGRKQDPYDCYEWLDALHLYCRIKPYYFFLVANTTGKYDKNISTDNKPFSDLIKYYSGKYKIGIHPSWQSGDDDRLLKEELEWMEALTDRKIVHSRQHFLRFTLPQTFLRLATLGIEKEFSMGYGTVNGFRASTCSSFYWYDLEREEQTTLRLFPFCFMDANAFFEQKLNPQQAYHELVQYYDIVKKLDGLFISVWHNTILGQNPQFEGWPAMFELFMKETVYWDAFC